MFEKNTRQVNHLLARMFLWCFGFIAALVVCSWVGIFEFGKIYTVVILVVGLLVSVTPSLLIHHVSDGFLKYYMLCVLAVFIGILGTNNKIGIYITYALVPILSCFYFEPKLVLRASSFSYLTMVCALYVNSATKLEVTCEGRSRGYIFFAYLMGFTIEFLLVSLFLYFLVRRAKQMMEDRDNALDASRTKTRLLSSVSHEIRTPMNAILGMAEVGLQKSDPMDVRECLSVIRTSSQGLLHIVEDAMDTAARELTAEQTADLSIAEDTFTDRPASFPLRNDAEAPEQQFYTFRTKSARVLIVDDIEINRQVLSALLEPLDVTIWEAEDGQAAVRLAKKTSFDLIFMDSHMPVLSGTQATVRIRQDASGLNRNTPIIAVTADAIRGTRESLLACGMTDYLVKPIDLLLLCRMVEKYLPQDKIIR